MTTKFVLLLLLLLTGCRHAVPVNTAAPLATVAVSPNDPVSPFLCRITSLELSCVATVDVRLRRGQTETEFRRGYQFTFKDPKGSGTGAVMFGCAGSNECGGGYIMYISGNTTVTPVEPARVWTAGNPARIPYGSQGIAEVTVADNAFTELRSRWTSADAGPQWKAGNGIVITCSEQVCTVSLK